MKTVKKQLLQRRTILSLSLLTAFGSAFAQDDGIKALVSPDSSISVGVAGVSGSSSDKALFGQYNDLRDRNAGVLLDIDINKRDDATGTWILLQGRDLGLDTRELNGAYVKQGDWHVSGAYNAIVRNDPRTLVTGAGNELNLSTKRESVGLAGGKWITPRLLFELDFKNEDKTGARLNGQGVACGVYSSAYNVCGLAAGTGAMLAGTTGGMLLVPEPVNSTIKQIDARLSYSGQNLKLHGGYYGSFYSNGNGSFSSGVSGNLFNPDGSTLNTGALPGSTLLGLLQQPVALAPDNQAHQFYVDGVYSFTPTTRANFKVARTHATQDADFVAMGLIGPVGVSNLGAVVDTTLAQIGLSARPMSKLSLLANVRYEDKEDQTPLANYNVTGPNQANVVASYTNNPRSSNKLNGKLEASYQFPHNYHGTFGLDYQEVHRDRPVSTALIDGLSGLREDTRETSYRAEVRRGMSETLNASLGYTHSKREGSSWLSLGAGFPAVADSVIYNAYGAFPFTLEDRTRDKVRASADWSPTKDLSLQFMVESGKDSYSAPSEQGLRDTDVYSYGVDATWKLSSKWKLAGYWNQGKQTQNVNHAGYLAELNTATDSLSLGAVGTPVKDYEVGANLSYMKDSNRYPLQLSSGLPLVGGGLPDVNYSVYRLNLFAKRSMEKNASLRVDLMHQRAELDDWGWGYNGVPFTYSDNGSVTQQARQNVTYLGVTYIYLMK
jgi:MtrB/PioB family decaheme-associated outer membrane protein